MPLERVSKGFKDISLSFQANPSNFDLVTITNETAIARSVRNLVYTRRGERFFNADIGSRVTKLLFETVDGITASLIKDEITQTIKNNEPRVNLIAVNVVPNDEQSEFNVDIIYQIVGLDAFAQQLSFVLLPTR
jgi:phage baseplate assembly protein W